MEMTRSEGGQRTEMRTGGDDLRIRVWVGCYTQKLPHVPDGKGLGVTQAALDLSTGTLSELKPPVSVGENPAWVCTNRCGSKLYVVNEVENGRVACFHIAPCSSSTAATATAPKAAHDLILASESSSFGSAPVHCELDQSETVLAVPNYSNGSLSIYTISPDGTLGDACAVFNLEATDADGGSILGPDQDAPHAHQARFHAASDTLFVPDKGTDRVRVFLRQGRGKWERLADTDVVLSRASGPRHMDFHPSLPIFYVVGEIDCQVFAVSMSAAVGPSRYRVLEAKSCLPEGYDNSKKQSNCAQILVHPSGNFLYVSIRGQNSIAVMSIDAESGLLSVHSHVDCGGSIPRNFMMTPSGEWLLVANQESHNITVFAIDGKSGNLALASAFDTFSPVTIAFAPF
eukprot:ANDGO_06574.mRNA.1 6-phosphogluconolactonase